MGFLDSLGQSNKPLLAINETQRRPPMPASAHSRRGYRTYLAFLAFAVGLTLLWQQHSHHEGASKAHPNDIHNRTLGFHRTFAISFPERTDKRDSLVLATSLTQWDLDWSDGVKFESISRKAAPVNWNYEKRTNGALGCWRAHMDVLQRIVHEKIQTALVLEDDSDWDTSIKQQLSQFATGARALQNSSTAGLRSPYGNDWDFLWLGHCKLGPRDHQSRFYVIEKDPTVAPVGRRNSKWMNDHIPDDVLSEDSRIVFKADNGGLCMYAYAITYEGAQKALAALSVTPRDDVVDMSYRRLCAGNFNMPFECYGSYPSLFGSHRAAGPASRDSDLNNKSDKWHAEYSFDVVYSTQQNINRLAAGDQIVQAQWPKEVKKSSKIATEVITGTGRLKNIDLRNLPVQEIPGINRNG